MKTLHWTKITIGLALSVTASCGGVDADSDQEALSSQTGSALKAVETSSTTAEAAGVLGERYVPADRFEIRSAAGQALLGRAELERRPRNTAIHSQSLPSLKFRSYSDGQVEVSLRSAAAEVLGPQASAAPLRDHGNSLALDIEDGIAWAARTSGAFSIKRRDRELAPTRIASPAEAVSLAVDHVARSGVLQLADGEGLDIISITGTHHSGWASDGEESVPVHFAFESGKQAVTSYLSEYTVTFGRTVRGVPVLGSTLSVRLGPSGEMVALTKRWRDIAQVGETQVALVSEGAAAQRISAEHATRQPSRTLCGYVESPPLGYRQAQAGVGCRYIFQEDQSVEGLAALESEWVNLASDTRLSLEGTRVAMASASEPEVSNLIVDNDD